jgi:5-methylcytosine-specific restriction endonuclease McrA
MNIWLHHVNPKKGYAKSRFIKDPPAILKPLLKQWPTGGAPKRLAAGDRIYLYLKNLPLHRPSGVYAVGEVRMVHRREKEFEWKVDKLSSLPLTKSPIPMSVVKQFFPRIYGGAWTLLPESQKENWRRALNHRPTSNEATYRRRAIDLLKTGAANPPAGQSNPLWDERRVKVFWRDPSVAAYVLSVAHGKCEGCGQPAPFNADDGEPYLEIHHMLRLADGGSDTINNTVALCPNCHRRAHFANDCEQLRKSIYSSVKRLQEEQAKTILRP